MKCVIIVKSRNFIFFICLFLLLSSPFSGLSHLIWGICSLTRFLLGWLEDVGCSLMTWPRSGIATLSEFQIWWISFHSLKSVPGPLFTTRRWLRRPLWRPTLSSSSSATTRTNTSVSHCHSVVRIFCPKIWRWKIVRSGFGSRLTAKLEIPLTKLTPSSLLTSNFLTKNSPSGLNECTGGGNRGALPLPKFKLMCLGGLFRVLAPF